MQSMGERLASARKRKKLSAQWVVNFLNGYLSGKNMRLVTLRQYYLWEKYGTEGEQVNSKSHPHPIVYKLLCIALGVTLYWLIYGDMGGRVIRETKDLPGGKGLSDIAQLSAYSPKHELQEELMRLINKLTPTQRTAAITFLRLI